MKKILLVLLGTTLLSLSSNAQTVHTKDGAAFSENRIEAVIEKLEKTPVEVIEVKTMKKWKALGLSTDMKDKMDYPVVRVKYKTDKLLKTMVIDVNLVPIDYDYAILEPK